MLRNTTTIPMGFVNGVLTGLRRRNAAATEAAVLKESGIPAKLLALGSARVTAAQFATLMLAIQRELDDEFLGLLSRPLRPGSLLLMTRVTLGSPTLASGLAEYARAFGLLQDDLRLVLQPQARATGLQLHFERRELAAQSMLHEFLLRTTWRLFDWLTASRLEVVGFDFQYPMPGHVHGYPVVFPAPHRFEQRCSAFWLAADVMERPIRRDQAGLAQFLQGAPANLLEPRGLRELTSQKVRASLMPRLVRCPGLPDLARELNTTVATLQRRLAAEGTTFQAVKDQLRRDVAIQRLSSSTVAIAVLADELGYADTTTFQRAFKAWTGSSPGSYRRELQGQDATSEGQRPAAPKP